MTLMIVPEDSSALDVLALRYSAAFDKTKAGREQWINGTLELAAVLLDIRKKYPDHREYARWAAKYQLECFLPNTRWALTRIGEMNSADARKLLEDNFGLTWRTIWEKKAKKPAVHPSEKGKGEQQAVRGRLSGSAQRKRRNRIPDVMREDYEPLCPPPVRKVPALKVLTPEQIDPDFKGTSIEFATKHGHVTLHTKDQIEHHKHQEALSVWLGAMADHYRTARALLTAAAALDPAVLQEWCRKPGKAEKFQAWCKDIRLACKGLEND